MILIDKINRTNISSNNNSTSIQIQIRKLTNERDNSLSELLKYKNENMILTKQLLDYNRMRMSYDHMKQNLDAMKISLDSSERIRKQQKTMITLIQKSQLVLEGGTGNLSRIGSGSDIDASSIDSRSIGSGAGVGMGVGHHSAIATASASASETAGEASRDTAAEHRSWLGHAHDSPHAHHHSHMHTHGHGHHGNDSVSLLSMGDSQELLESTNNARMSGTGTGARTRTRTRPGANGGIATGTRNTGKPPRGGADYGQQGKTLAKGSRKSSLNSSILSGGSGGSGRSGGIDNFINQGTDVVNSLIHASRPRSSPSPYKQIARRLPKTPGAIVSSSGTSSNNRNKMNSLTNTGLPPRPPSQVRHTSGRVAALTTAASRQRSSNLINTSVNSFTSVSDSISSMRSRSSITKPKSKSMSKSKSKSKSVSTFGSGR